MNNIKLYKILALAAVGLILLVLFSILLFSKPKPPIPAFSEGPQPGESFSYTSDQDKQFIEQGAKVAQLIEKLPHQGKYFKLEYSFSGNAFILSFNRNQEVLADNEFAIFLKDNQILSKEWLQNLQKVGK